MEKKTKPLSFSRALLHHCLPAERGEKAERALPYLAISSSHFQTSVPMLSEPATHHPVPFLDKKDPKSLFRVIALLQHYSGQREQKALPNGMSCSCFGICPSASGAN